MSGNGAAYLVSNACLKSGVYGERENARGMHAHIPLIDTIIMSIPPGKKAESSQFWGISCSIDLGRKFGGDLDRPLSGCDSSALTAKIGDVDSLL